jgi:hypothetical protein
LVKSSWGLAHPMSLTELALLDLFLEFFRP